MTNKTGTQGELLAEKYLLQKGYKVLCKNWHCHWGEIDIVAFYKTNLVFAEVKYRTGNSLGLPEDAITYYKKRNLYRSINYFLLKSRKKDVNWRLDVLCLVSENSHIRLRHYYNMAIC
jgi:putative endonuclease